MENVRDGTTSVYCLKQEIRKAVYNLRGKYYRVRLGGNEYLSRVERQLQDADRFLGMLNESRYASCKTVDELKQRISRRRNKLKEELAGLDVNTSGHQLSIFDLFVEQSEEEKQQIEERVENLKEEIHWLHKCLGICKNKDYFN